MALALFDLDHTLVAADTPALWFQYLIEKGQLREEDVREKAVQYTHDYETGTLNYPDYIRFELATIAGLPIPKLLEWRSEFQMQHIRPNVSEEAHKLVNQHRQAGDTVAIVTATNDFVSRAGAEELGVDILIATNAEQKQGRYTGDYTGVECFQAGKITKLKQWMDVEGHTLEGSWFYSDSSNDLPLLEVVENPVVVNADDRLSQIAKTRNWPSMRIWI